MSGSLSSRPAVVDTVPDVHGRQAAWPSHRKRADLWPRFSRRDKTRIALRDKRKSTVTGMIGWILDSCGKKPSIVNGAVMKNFVTPEAPFASAAVGDPALMVVEADESDGSIALYNPTIAVLNNIALDHKSMEELRALFAAFIGKAQIAILNLENEEVAGLAPFVTPAQAGVSFGSNEKKRDARFREHDNITYSLRNPVATLLASNLSPRPDGVTFDVRYAPTNEQATVRLKVPGEHNVANALAALGAALAAGIPFADAAKALETFKGIARRMDVIVHGGGDHSHRRFRPQPRQERGFLKTLLTNFRDDRLYPVQMHGLRACSSFFTLPSIADCYRGASVTGKTFFICLTRLYLGGTNQSIGGETAELRLAADIAVKGRMAAHLPSDRGGCSQSSL
jgi:UDP-N-acetylmuramate--alanine ligase